MKWYTRISISILAVALIIVGISAIIIGRPFTAFIAFIAVALAVMVVLSA